VGVRKQEAVKNIQI